MEGPLSIALAEAQWFANELRVDRTNAVAFDNVGEKGPGGRLREMDQTVRCLFAQAIEDFHVEQGDTSTLVAKGQIEAILVDCDASRFHVHRDVVRVGQSQSAVVVRGEAISGDDVHQFVRRPLEVLLGMVALVNVQFERFSTGANLVRSLKGCAISNREAEFDLDALSLTTEEVRRTQPMVDTTLRCDITHVLCSPQGRCQRGLEKCGKQFRFETQFAPAVVHVPVSRDLVPIEVITRLPSVQQDHWKKHR